MVATQLRLHEATFRAFGSNCRVVCDVNSSVDFAISRLEDLESRWSRFRSTSEVNEVNSRPGEWCEVSMITADLFAAGARAAELTHGTVNPLMLHQIEHLGYARSHEHLDLSTSQLTASISIDPGHTGAVEVDGGSVRIPHGTGFDPGGVGKGLAADLVVTDLVEQGASWAMVSLGGDIRFAGPAVAKVAPAVHIDDPRVPGAVLGATRLVGGALATSSTVRRRWNADGAVHHHLLDPATGMPSTSPRIAASVYAPSAWLADVAAKAVIINPSLGQLDLNAWGAEGVAFTQSDTIDLGMPVLPLEAEAKAAS